MEDLNCGDTVAEASPARGPRSGDNELKIINLSRKSFGNRKIISKFSCVICLMLHQHRHLTKWRSAFLDGRELLHSNRQPNRGHIAIPQSHQDHVFPDVYKSSFNQFSNNKIIKLGSWNMVQLQNYSSQGGQQGFVSRLLENFKQEMAKNKEMKENLKKFREEADKLEHSEALQKARAKYKAVESEASALKGKLGKVKETVTGAFEEVGKTEIAKKAGKISEEIGKSARDAAEAISHKSKKLGHSETFKTISDATAAVREELEQSGSQARVYVAPTKLRKRQELLEGEDRRVYEADTSTTDVELHKDSRFAESWQNFKNNNPYYNKIIDWKMKYDESENPVIRMSRVFTDKLSYVVGEIFQNTELSDTLTEIVKIDPSFSKVRFFRQCETDIIPNILEAMVRGDLEILKDWCHERTYKVLSTGIRQVQAVGGKLESKVLDIEGLDLRGGKIMEQGPVLIISFTSQQIFCVRDRKTGKIIEGDPDSVMRVNYVWALSRDKTELDPKAAWRLLDISASSTQQFL